EQSFECSAIDRSMLRPEGNDAQGRQSELRRELLAVDLIGFGVHAAKVSQITPTVNFGVAVQDFAPESPFGKSNPVIMSRNRCEIQDGENPAGAIVVLPHKREDTVFVV